MALHVETFTLSPFAITPNPKTQSILTSQKHLKPSNSQETTLHLSANTKNYASILDKCKYPTLGKQVHAHTLKMGFHGHEFVDTKLLQMYVKCGCFEFATQVFDRMTVRNLYAYVAIITLYIGNGMFEEAFEVYLDLLFEGVELEFFLFPVVLKICFGFGDVDLGRQLHGQIIKNGFFSNVYVGNSLIDMYGKCGDLVGAKSVFNTMPAKDSVSWNSMVTAYTTNGMVFEAVEMMEKMSDELTPNLVSWSALMGGFSQNGYDLDAIETLYRMKSAGFVPNEKTLACVLPSCARLEMLSLGKEIHGYVTRHGYMSNPIVVNGLLDVYRKCADIGSARKIFSIFSDKTTVSLNTMIVGYCENREIHEAKKLFDMMELLGIRRDVISWNSMISGYVDNFMFDEALSLYIELLTEEEVSTNSYTFGSIITACAERGSLRLGKEVHSQAILRGLQSNSFVGRALIEMYSGFKDLKAGQIAFNEILEKDTPTWNTLLSCYAHCKEVDDLPKTLQKMKDDGFNPNIYTWNGIIAGHVENGYYKLAMQLFSELQTSDMRSDIYTTGTILTACSRLATIKRGKQVHAHSIRFGYETNSHIGAAIVDMYAKCGNIDYAKKAFYRIKIPNLVSYNAMLTAYSMYGLGEDGLSLFNNLLEGGFKPDGVTFLSVLSSCVHFGAVERGKEIFCLMGDYDVKPTLKHFTCVVDLLSRAGHIEEASKVLNNMPVEPDSVIYGALLGGCVSHCNVNIGEKVAERLINLEPDNAGNYVMLVNLYAAVGRWSDVARTRKLMKDKEMQKEPGCSWIENRYETHVFVASDTSHPRTDEIYATLDHLTYQMITEFGTCM